MSGEVGSFFGPGPSQKVQRDALSVPYEVLTRANSGHNHENGVGDWGECSRSSLTDSREDNIQELLPLCNVREKLVDVGEGHIDASLFLDDVDIAPAVSYPAQRWNLYSKRGQQLIKLEETEICFLLN